MKSAKSAKVSRAPSADEYASLVAKELMLRGVVISEAITTVQTREVAILTGHASGSSPKKVASRILAQSRRTSGPEPKNVSAAAGCALVPIEGFFFSDDLAEIPPMSACSTFEPDLPGLAFGKIRRSRRPSRRGRVAGAFGSEEVLYRIATAANQKMPLTALESISKRIFGRAVTRQEFEETFSGRTKDAFQKASLKAVVVSEQKRGLPATMKLIFALDTGTMNLGQMVRVYYRDQNDVPQAYHSIYEIDGKTNLKSGKGLGAEVTRNTLRFYRSLGVGSIDTNAEWVGRYVWAAFGFQWSLDEADRKAEELLAYLEPRIRRGQLRPKGSFGHTTFDFEDRPNPWKSLRELIEARAITSSSWKTASLFFNNPVGEPEHVGKPFLAGVSTPEDFKVFLPGQQGAEGWQGTLVLSDRHPTWQIAKARLGL